METPKFEDLNDSNCTARSMRIHYPEFYEYLMTKYPEELKFTERLYWYYNNLNAPGYCIECGKPTKFINYKQGYRECCSAKCVSRSQIIQDRKKQTSLERYGVESPMKTDAVKNKLKETNLKKHGVENPFQSEVVKEKIRSSNIEKLGVPYPMMSQEVLDKSKQTCLEKYGVEYYSQSQECIEHKRAIKDETISKMKDTNKKVFLSTHPEIIDCDDTSFTMTCPDSNCSLCSARTFVVPKTIYYARKSLKLEMCTNRNPIHSNTNTQPELFVQDVLNECNTPYETTNRVLLNGRELDIYIPSHKLAIECNGCYWHSSTYKNPNYHFDKYNDCKNQDIQLLTVWDDWILYKPELLRSLIKSKLGIFEHRIGARNCEIKEVSNNDCNEFLEQNHIQGTCNSKIRLGLYYNQSLISIMTFSKHRSAMMGHSESNDDKWELTRFCNRMGWQVVGGASKLLHHFIRKYNPKHIISYSSHDISNGSLYDKLGFIKTNTTKSSYWYVHSRTMKRYHRFNFRKSKLVKMGYDPNMTEDQIMSMLDYWKIYDSGQDCWEYII